MDNKVSRLLDVNFPDPNHSNFNLGRKNTFTCDVGYLVPCYVEEILTSSYKRLDLEALVQCNATVAPVMGSFTIKADAYFIPIRLYHQHLLNNDRSNNFSDDFLFHYFPWLDNTSSAPYRHLTGDDNINNVKNNLVVAPGSLLEYFGMFPAGWNARTWARHNLSGGESEPRINAYPFIGYFDIYRNYYANPYDTDIPMVVDNSGYIFEYDTLNRTKSDDRYVSLTAFDTFINSIKRQSLVAATGAPAPVNVFNVFNNCFQYGVPASGGTQTLLPVPLFEGQRSIGYTADIYGSINGINFGLLRRTYKDDYFNARISTEFVQYLKEQSRVLVQDNYFDITQLRLANRIAKYVDKLGFSDSRFGSWLKAHFGTKLNDKANIPQFLGSISSTLNFQDIISNAQTGSGDAITSNEALGSRAGLGSSYMKNDGAFVEFRSVEPGYLVVLFSIVPNVSYFQGIRKMFLKTRFADIYTPEFDAVGYQDLQTIEMSAIGAQPYSSESIGGTFTVGEYNAVVGKQPSWIEYMCAIDESHGLVTQFSQYGYWALNRPFDLQYFFVPDTITAYGGRAINDFSTYIKPQIFNQIFAVNKQTHNFQVQIRFFDKTAQPMSKQVLPRL